MQLKKLGKSWALQSTRNIVQFLIGLTFYVAEYQRINPFNLMVGLASFSLSYLSVYLFNDLMDYEEDAKRVDELKEMGRYKALVYEHLTKKDATSLMYLLVVIGLTLSSFVNFVFSTLVMVALLMNFLYSSNWFQFRKDSWKLSGVMLVCQMIKYSSGWFTQTSTTGAFPFWPMMMLSLVYVFSLIIYKEGGTNMDVEHVAKASKRKKKILLLVGFGTLASLILTIVLHPIKIALLLTLIVGGLSILISKKLGISKKVEMQNVFVGLVGAVFVLSILLFSLNPTLSAENERVEAFSESIKENISSIFPDDSELVWYMINNPEEYTGINTSLVEEIREWKTKEISVGE